MGAQWLEFHANVWTFLVALVTTSPATLAAIKALRKIDDVGKKVNGNYSELSQRNRQLTAILSEHGIVVPATLDVREDEEYEGRSKPRSRYRRWRNAS